MRIYAPKKKGKYWVDAPVYRMVVQWCRCYPTWLKELKTPPDTSKAITYDSDKVQTSGGYDATAELAIRRQELAEKVRLLNDAAKMASPDLYMWIIKGTTENIPARDLVQQGMPCHENTYNTYKRKFYWILSKRI